MKKLVVFMLVLSMAVTSAFANGTAEGAGQKTYVTVGTAAAGGAFYPVGIAIASAITNNVPNVEASAQVTGGAIENCSLVHNGEVDVAITMSGSAFQAYNGEGAFTEAYPDLRILFNGLSMGTFHVVTLKRTGITEMTDLIGKTVVMGPAGGGAIVMAEAIWGAYGFSIDDIKPTYVSYSDGISALKDGKVDAVVVQSAPPASAIQELCATNADDVVLMSVDDDIAQKIIDSAPYYAARALSKDVYGTSEDVTVIYQTNLLICNESMSEEMAYNITRSCVENAADIAASEPTARDFSAENSADNCPIPLHPGAEKYFKEVGLL